MNNRFFALCLIFLILFVFSPVISCWPEYDDENQEILPNGLRKSLCCLGPSDADRADHYYKKGKDKEILFINNEVSFKAKKELESINNVNSNPMHDKFVQDSYMHSLKKSVIYVGVARNLSHCEASNNFKRLFDMYGEKLIEIGEKNVRIKQSQVSIYKDISEILESHKCLSQAAKVLKEAQKHEESIDDIDCIGTTITTSLIKEDIKITNQQIKEIEDKLKEEKANSFGSQLQREVVPVLRQKIITTVILGTASYAAANSTLIKEIGATYIMGRFQQYVNRIKSD